MDQMPKRFLMSRLVLPRVSNFQMWNMSYFGSLENRIVCALAFVPMAKAVDRPWLGVPLPRVMAYLWMVKTSSLNIDTDTDLPDNYESDLM
jgi:hypothetical protein